MGIYILDEQANKDVEESVVGVPLVTAALAGVEDGAAFVCTTQLLGVISHFFLSAFFARMSDDCRSLHVFLCERLYFGSLGAEGRWESARFGVCHNDLGGGV